VSKRYLEVTKTTSSYAEALQSEAAWATRRVARTLRPLEEVIRLRRWSLSTSSAAGSQLNYSADC